MFNWFQIRVRAATFAPNYARVLIRTSFPAAGAAASAARAIAIAIAAYAAYAFEIPIGIEKTTQTAKTPDPVRFQKTFPAGGHGTIRFRTGFRNTFVNAGE